MIILKKTKKTRVKRAPRKTKIIDGVICSVRGVPLTRASNTMTEAQFFSWILSNARRLTIKWKPRNDKLNEGRVPYKGNDKRTKWCYSCEHCGQYFKRSQIDLDHIVPCGGISCFEDIEGWYRRAFVEKDGFRRLCIECHNRRTQQDRIMQKLRDEAQDLDMGY